MKLSQVRIPAGNFDLAGLTYVPDGEAKRVCVVLSHGFTASKESVDLLAAYLAGRGYPCLTFDCRGHKLGATRGRLERIEEAVEDLRAAKDWARTRLGCEQCVLAGHSMGGILSIAVAAGSVDVAAVCAIAIGPEPTAGFRGPAGQAMLAQRSDYVDGAPPLELLEQMGVLVGRVTELSSIPSLFVAARGDVLVKSEKLRDLAHTAGPRAEFAEVDGSHLEAPDRARGVVANWLDRTLR